MATKQADFQGLQMGQGGAAGDDARHLHGLAQQPGLGRREAVLAR
ncbi:MAG: hypothetical protein P8129_01215 [Anaerolineae bacterium]